MTFRRHIIFNFDYAGMIFILFEILFSYQNLHCGNLHFLRRQVTGPLYNVISSLTYILPMLHFCTP